MTKYIIKSVETMQGYWDLTFYDNETGDITYESIRDKIKWDCECAMK